MSDAVQPLHAVPPDTGLGSRAPGTAGRAVCDVCPSMELSECLAQGTRRRTGLYAAYGSACVKAEGRPTKNAVWIKASYWVGLAKSGYYGRNLITQGMYLGHLRYWLYSLGMNRQMREIVQKHADILWWAREPKLESASNNGIADKNRKRIRRWVARGTATGPRTRGGLGNMDWGEHVQAIKAQWIIRYLQPGDAAWKRILDSWILGDNKLRTKYPEGRVAVLLKLTNQQRLAMLRSIPSGARY